MKYITLVLIVCSFAITANAQVSIKPGIRAGLNLSTLTNPVFDNKADFYVGGFLAVKFTNLYTFQPELSYTRQGAKGTVYYPNPQAYEPDPGYSYSLPYKLDYGLQYISLGVMNKFDIIKGFHVIAGPSVDVRISDDIGGSIAQKLKGLDLGLSGGIGYTLPIGLTIEARYKMGLLDIFDDNYKNAYYYGDNSIKNSVVQLGLAYTFK